MKGTKKEKILIVDDDLEYLASLKNAMEWDFVVETAASPEDAKILLAQKPNLVLLDIRLQDSDPMNRDGIELLKFIRDQNPDIAVVMMTAYGDVDTAVEAMKLGASDFIQKTRADVRELKKIVAHVLDHSKLLRRVQELQENLNLLEPLELVGDDPKIAEIKSLIKAIAKDGEATVLIRGETGTGKELVARSIYSEGTRNEGPFVPVSIGALSKGVIESELFGHEKGAFTGADRRKIGYIERANQGVLFLDEIGELDPEIQLKLLRFLDGKAFTRVGGVNETKVDLQVIAATNKNLEKEVEEGRFRKDLYFRLKTFQIFLPALSDRPVDIPKLALHFLSYFNLQGRTSLRLISSEALHRLQKYDWPGNVRELKSCIERSIIYAAQNGHDRIEMEDLPLEVYQTGLNPRKEVKIKIKVNIEEEKARLELMYIEEAIRASRGRKTEAWKLLGYNDRFSLRRRVLSIAEKFDELIDQFPYLRNIYLHQRGKDGENTIPDS